MHHSPIFLLVKPSPLILPISFGLRREPPRRPEDRQPDYLNKFDFRTVYYDVFEVDGVVTGIGPPARNLKGYITDSTVRIDGGKATIDLVELDRIQITRFHAHSRRSGLLSFDHPLGNISCEVGRDFAPIFSGMNVVTTKSKNNALSWICDWARFYVTNHKVTGIVLYDNGSTDYSPADLLDALRSTPGLKACAVVEWNYPWGSPGGRWAGNKSVPWDSDYCQYGAMEHARRRLLRNARSVINHDIDELLVADGGLAAVDVLTQIGAAGIQYPGRWIETVGGPIAGEPSFFNFGFYDKDRTDCAKKWVVSPLLAKDAAQWEIHSVAGLDLVSTDVLCHRHFMGINNNWKYNRTKPSEYDPARHIPDEGLSLAMARAFATPRSMLRNRASRSKRLIGKQGMRPFVTTEASGFPAYWRETEGDFGAAVGPWLVSMITGEEIRNVRGDSSATIGVVSTGSLLNNVVNKGLIVWGTGAIAPFSDEDARALQRLRPNIRAVRGKITAGMLSSLGIDVPPILGDPALLLPRFYCPEFRRIGVVVCPARRHRTMFPSGEFDDHQVIDIRGSPADVAAAIASASCCISTSLYGLMLAQAYGVPWVWLRAADVAAPGEELPFEDFFTALDREKVAVVQVDTSEMASLNFKKLADHGQLPKLSSRPDLLLDAFPVLQQAARSANARNGSLAQANFETNSRSSKLASLLHRFGTAVIADMGHGLMNGDQKGATIAPHMPEPAVAALTTRLQKAKCYLEFGCGGSTILAAGLGVPRIISVDTSSEWVQKVKADIARNSYGGVFTPLHVDIGRTVKWGYPATDARVKKWPRYFFEPWRHVQAESLSPDLVLIDGRFRICCLLASLAHAPIGTILLFDDYANREHYHVVEQLLKPVNHFDRMAEFIKLEEPSLSSLLALMAESLFDTR